MKKSGHSDLPLHYGHVPIWLSERMTQLGTLIIEALVYHYGKKEVLKRISDPLWFQSLGCVLGMDWHSSGITTSVLGALKRGINPISHELGIYICGGRGKYSRQTPTEIKQIADKLSLPGEHLIECSKLSAKIDNTAIQDGFNLYLHCFILTDDGDWAVVQQGMNTEQKLARRYHWHSEEIQSFVEEPHTGIVGENQGLILNLTDKDADKTRQSMLTIAKENPLHILPEIKKIIMPRHHEVTAKDVDLKRLGAVLALAYNQSVKDFCSLLLVNGLGPRTLQSLVLVSEVIFGTPSRFKDPARYSFAHGGKDGHPFPVPLKVYDESITTLKTAINKAKLGVTDRINCLKKLTEIQKKVEKQFDPKAVFDKIIAKERKDSYKYGGKTVFGDAKKEDDYSDSLF